MEETPAALPLGDARPLLTASISANKANAAEGARPASGATARFLI